MPTRRKTEDNDVVGIEERRGRGKVTSSVKSASMEAPLNADRDFLADASEDNMAAFFSSGTGPAMHYHLGDAAGVGQEPQGEEAAR